MRSQWEEHWQERFSQSIPSIPGQERPLAFSPGDSDHSAGHHPDQAVPDGEEGSVGATVAERDAEPLGAAQGDVHAKLPRWTQYAEGQ